MSALIDTAEDHDDEWRRDDKWRLEEDPASVQVLRDILIAAESAYDPEGWDGRLWADVVDPRTGDYRRDALSMLSDPKPERAYRHDSQRLSGRRRFPDKGFDLSDERLSGCPTLQNGQIFVEQSSQA
jgi:hypothetical protein